jgi:hypothetical protein
MAQSDVFALKNSGLEPFLFAEVGDEPNGSGLTVLSLLARLGHDPWAEAARLVDLPKAAAIDSLAGSMARMPVCARVPAEARATAARLILLLPVNNPAPRLSAGIMPQDLAGLPKWLPMTLLYCALVVGMGLSMIMAPHTEAVTPIPRHWTDKRIGQPRTRPADPELPDDCNRKLQ